jgi:hypothetical protein
MTREEQIKCIEDNCDAFKKALLARGAITCWCDPMVPC